MHIPTRAISLLRSLSVETLKRQVLLGRNLFGKIGWLWVGGRVELAAHLGEGQRCFQVWFGRLPKIHLKN